MDSPQCVSEVMVKKYLRRLFLFLVLLCVAVALPFALLGRNEAPPAPTSTAIVGTELATKQAADGSYISWVEHRIDDQGVSGVELRSADGLLMADIDNDGFEDVVAVYEESSHLRISFGSANPNLWHHVTIAEHRDVFAAEDVSVGDLNGDGWLDLIVAAEVAHLLYLQNPGAQSVRSEQWQRLRPTVTNDKGSWISADMADFNGDGQLEILATNKGIRLDTLGFQDTPSYQAILRMYRSDPTPVHVFTVTGDPLSNKAWKSDEVTTLHVPINAKPVDFDQDGDVDIVAGSRGRGHLVWLENDGSGSFTRHEIAISNWLDMASDAGFPMPTGMHMAFHDMDGDGRLDIVCRISLTTLGWIRQPASPDGDWRASVIARYKPDHLAGFSFADIDGDGDLDIMTGTYSKGPSRDDTYADRLDKPVGRLAWLENPSDVGAVWPMHNLVRRQRGMFDEFVPRDMDGDGDMDFVGVRGSSGKYDGVFWLEQQRTAKPQPIWTPAREAESQRYPLSGG